MADIKAFLDQIASNPKLVEKLERKGQTKTETEKIKALLDIGKELGYVLTAEDLKAYFIKQEQNLREKTDAQTQEIQKLDDNELALASGGIMTKRECKYTYLIWENCLFSDKCDRVFVSYLSDLDDQYKDFCVPNAAVNVGDNLGF